MTVRRVVTADAGGEAAIASDTAVEPLPIGEAQLYELWRAGPGGTEAPLDGPWSLDPPEGGHVFRISVFPPAAPGEAPWMHRTDTIDYALVLEGELTLVTEAGETRLLPGDVVVQQAADHGWINRTDRPARMVVVLIDRQRGSAASLSARRG
jgi:quercetin dioxygenase-like cupin family protein